MWRQDVKLDKRFEDYLFISDLGFDCHYGNDLFDQVSLYVIDQNIKEKIRIDYWDDGGDGERKDIRYWRKEDGLNINGPSRIALIYAQSKMVWTRFKSDDFPISLANLTETLSEKWYQDQ